MPKKGKKHEQSRDEKLERKLADAQARLADAQSKRADVKRKGEESVQRARVQAEHRLRIATASVEKRAAQVSALQDRQLMAKGSFNGRENQVVIPPNLQPEPGATDLQGLQERDDEELNVIFVPEAPNAGLEDMVQSARPEEVEPNS